MPAHRLRLSGPVLAAALLVGACSSAPTGDESEGTADPSTRGDTASAPSSSSTSPPDTTETPDTPSRIDPCLLGTWVQVGMRQTVELEGEPAVMTGWKGRRLTFRPNGSEVVSYATATPLVATSANHRLRSDYRGVSVYQVRTRGHRLIFDTADHGRARIVQTYDGQRSSVEPAGSSSPVRYTCTDTRHTQRSGHYRATFRRL